MCTPPPSLSSIDYNKQDFYSNYVFTEAQDSVLLLFPPATMKSRPKPVVRLPPSGPSHASQHAGQLQQNPSSISRHYDDSLAKSTPAWQELFKSLMANRDPTATKPSNTTTAAPTTIDVPNGSVSDDAASSGVIEYQGPDTEANRSGRKKRRRHRGGKGRREANPDGEIGGEALQSPSLRALESAISGSSTTLLLQDASNLGATAAASTTIESSEESISGDAISGELSDEQLKATGAQNKTGQTRSGCRGGRQKTRTDLIDLDNQTEHEVFQAASLRAVESTLSGSSAALLLQNASKNWMTVCHLLMGEVSLNEREILNQIMYLISRLGTGSNQTSTDIECTSFGKEDIPKTHNPTESMPGRETNAEHRAAPGPSEGEQNSFHPSSSTFR